jgi:hypothetical protein
MSDVTTDVNETGTHRGSKSFIQDMINEKDLFESADDVEEK